MTALMYNSGSKFYRNMEECCFCITFFLDILNDVHCKEKGCKTTIAEVCKYYVYVHIF